MKTGKFRKFCDAGGKTGNGKLKCGIPLMRSDKTCPSCGVDLKKKARKS